MVYYEPLQRVEGTWKDQDRRVRTVCQECTVGCGVVVYLKDNAIIDIQGDESHPISRGRLCAKGIAFVQGLTSTLRITIPAIRQRVFGPFETSANWSKTIDSIAEQLRRAREQHSPKSMIIACDPEAGLDFYLGARRFARLWGTPYVFHPWEDPYHQPKIPLKAPVHGCDCWPESRSILLVEADLAVTHPVAFGWVLEAQQKGTKIVAVDSRFTTTLSKADFALKILPRSGNLLGLYLMKSLLEEGLIDQDACDANLSNFPSWKESFDRLSWEDVLSRTGLSRGQVTHVARLMHSRSPSTVITGKRLARQRHHGIWLSMATATNWINTGSGGWYPVEAGIPPFNPDSDVEDLAGNPNTTQPKLTPYAACDNQKTIRSSEEEFRIMIGSGDCLGTFLNPMQSQLKKLEFTVHFGAYPNFTAKSANAVIPPSVWAERDSLWINNDRAIQWAPQIVAPRDACCSGLDFWIGLAHRLGWQEHFPWQKKNGDADHFAFYQWLLKRRRETAGCDLVKLRAEGGLQYWPKNEEPLLKANPPIFSTADGRLEPVSVPDGLEDPAQRKLDEAFPLYFQSGRIVSRSSDSSNYWPWIEELENSETVQVHPDTAATLGIENGDPVIVAGPRQSMEGKAWISRMVDRRMVWTPHFLDEDFVVIHKTEQSAEEARKALRELFQ